MSNRDLRHDTLTTDNLSAAIREAVACRRCEAVLPLGPRPVFRVSETARVLIVGQAPGTKVHMTGLPWNDASGDRLRGWLLMDRDLFYDSARIAIVPMGLCYPGRSPRGGDAPPRPECAPLWLDRFVRLMPQVRLTLLVGSYALRHRLGKGAMTDRVRRFLRAWTDAGTATASILAHDGLGAAQFMVQRGTAAGVAAGSYDGTGMTGKVLREDTFKSRYNQASTEITIPASSGPACPGFCYRRAAAQQR